MCAGPSGTFLARRIPVREGEDAWQLLDAGPAVLGKRILRAISRKSFALDDLTTSFLAKPCWREWPVEPHVDLEFSRLATPADALWAFDWAYLVSLSERRIDLHSADTLRQGLPPLDSVAISPGGQPSRTSFRLPRRLNPFAAVRRARTLEELRDALAESATDFRSCMLAMHELRPEWRLTRAEREALVPGLRVTYFAREGGTCVRVFSSSDGTYRYEIQALPT